MTIEIDHTPLEQIQEAVDRCGAINFQVAMLSEQMAMLQQEKSGLLKVTIPALLKELGVGKQILPTGETVEIEKNLSASIPKENVEEAFIWLRDNKHGDVIKHEVKVAFTDGDKEKVDILEGFCKRQKFTFKTLVSVHGSTLAAALRKYPESKKELIPKELLGVTETEEVVIKMV